MSAPLWLKPFEWLDVYFLKPIGRFLKAPYAGFLLIPAALIFVVTLEQYNNSTNAIERICNEMENIAGSAALPPDPMMQLSECMNILILCYAAFWLFFAFSADTQTCTY